MQTLRTYINYLANKLQSIYETREAKSVAELYVAEILNLSKTELFLIKNDKISSRHLNLLEKNSNRLINGEPIQYIVNRAWFYSYPFYVDKNVLIPRQETEIIIKNITEQLNNIKNPKILDIGTGSGCISIALKLSVQNVSVYALDISKNAIEVAQKNAKNHNVDISFKQHDILSENDIGFNEKFDIIISNPPYVRFSERNMMHKNVVNFEPDIALYVNDDEPLIFYDKILQKTQYILNDNGQIWFEINEAFANHIVKLCKQYHYQDCQVIKDLNNKDRFVRCCR